MSKESLIIRLKEQLRIYKDSPSVTVTYIDLARLVEDLLEIAKEGKIQGFNGKKD